jgi:phosphoglycerate dehydrogenase-like enzyme
VFDACPGLKVIARAGVGYDAVDVAEASKRGVAVTFAPGTNQDAVAEHTFLLILALAKNFLPQHASIAAGGWSRQANLPLRGRTLGLLGTGRIGKAVALRGLAFGMPVIAHDPYPDRAFLDANKIPLVSMEEVLSRSDYLSLHTPLMPETRQLINKRTLALMKPSAFLINTARGGLVNEADLAEALSTGKLAGAGLDVFDEEPPAKGNPLVKMDNVVMTAHTAGVDWQSLRDMAKAAATGIASLARGEWPEHLVVNPEARARFKW